MRLTCPECGSEFYPWRERMFEREQITCGKAECQRARKTRLQRERRDQKRSAAKRDQIEWLRQGRSSLPQIAGKVKQRPAGVRQRGSTLPPKQCRPTVRKVSPEKFA